MRDLAMLMIAISDNTVADPLLARLGKQRVERAMADIGCGSVRVAFSIRELFEELTDAPGADYATLKRLLVSAGSGGRAVIAERTVRATRRDICHIFEGLDLRVDLALAEVSLAAYEAFGT